MGRTALPSLSLGLMNPVSALDGFVRNNLFGPQTYSSYEAVKQAYDKKLVKLLSSEGCETLQHFWVDILWEKREVSIECVIDRRISCKMFLKFS